MPSQSFAETRIPGAYTAVEQACRQKLAQLYPAGIPEFASERLELELAYAKASPNMQDNLEIYRRISQEALRAGLFLTLRGSAPGSFLYYLLGNFPMNPLPAHYYCPECGHYELAKWDPTEYGPAGTRPAGNNLTGVGPAGIATTGNYLAGIDLPEKRCPACSAVMRSDGFNIRPEMVFGLNGEKKIEAEYNATEELFPFFRKILTEAFPGCSVEILGMPCLREDDNTTAFEHSGFVILPEGRTSSDYPEISGYLKDGTPCILYSGPEIWQEEIQRVLIYPHKTIKRLIALQRATGHFITDIALNDLRPVRWTDYANTGIYPDWTEFAIRDLRPGTFTEMVCLEAASHHAIASGEGCTPENKHDYQTLINFFNSEEIKKYPCFTRDDFFETFLALGLPREMAYKMTFAVRTGQAHLRKRQWPEMADAAALPEELRRLCEKYLYAWMRSQASVNTLFSAMMAYYMRMDSRTYSSVLNTVR